MRGLYKKIDKAATSWDIYCDCVKTNPALKKIIRRKLRKTLDNRFRVWYNTNTERER